MLITESKRLTYFKFKTEDYAAYHSLSSNKQVMQYITERPLNATETKERFQKILKLNEGEELQGVFIVRKKPDNQFVGLAKATIYASDEVEIGYALMPEFWGRGLGFEISQTMVSYSQSIKSAKVLVAIIDPSNVASRRILEKCGFSFFEEKMMNGLPGAIYKKKNQA